MKTTTKTLVTSIAALQLLVTGIQAQIIVSDDFSDLNDTENPAWVHLTGYVGSTGQSWDASGGNYRLQALNNGMSGYGFGGSYVPTLLTDSITRVDFVNFGGPGLNPVFAVAGRLNGNNAALSLTGYGLAYEPFASGGLGEMVLYRISGPSLLADIGSLQVTLNPAKDYTFELTLQGSQITGRIYEIGGGLVGERQATDATYASGYSGVLGYSATGFAPMDFTADNFVVSQVPEPTTACLMVVGLAAFLVQRHTRKNL